MKKLSYLTVLVEVLGFIVSGLEALANSVGLVTDSGASSLSGLGLTLNGSGANELVSIDPVTGALAVVGAGLPSGIHNFAATLDLTDSRYFYRTEGNLISDGLTVRLNIQGVVGQSYGERSGYIFVCVAMA